MKVTLIVVPPGGGEQEYQLDFDLPAVPQPNAFITVVRQDQEGTPGHGYECFFVRRVWWDLKYPHSRPTSGDGDVGSAYMIGVEAEPARGPWMAPSHTRMCEAYESRGLRVRNFLAE